MFGFIKKIINAITGKGESKKNNSYGGSKHQNAHGKKRGNERVKNQQQKQSRNNKNKWQKHPHSADAQHQSRNNNQKKQNSSFKNQRGNNERQHFDNSQNNRANRQKARSSNTAANEMRPGGVISSAEEAARKAAHASWDPETFKVDVIEGKKRFHDFNLPGEVMHGIADLGFQYCTEIQALSLAHALDGKNIAGKAQTGSGKTAAFLVAIFTRYLRTPESRAKTAATPRALVIAPTRELVIQICKDADAIGKYCGLRSLAVYGGMDFDRQKEELLDAPVDLLVATPGRLLDFCKRRVLNLSCVDTLVIDEADRMLDMGFIPDVSRIMHHLPPKDKRATMLYSATLNEEVMQLASRWMEEPVRAEVESEHNSTDTVRQVVYVIRAEDKFKVLFNHISLHREARAIIFCNRKTTTEDVASSLVRRGIACEVLSGDVSQNKRLKVLEDFRSGKVKIVVATDVAGRGIHVDDIDYVINFDFPYEAEDYVHRIGRTGRAGNTGIAISFADEDESFAIPEIEEYIKEPLKCTIIQEDDPLLKPLPPRLGRGEKATFQPVDEAAKATVDAREAVTEEQKAAAAAVVGNTQPNGLKVKNALGKEMILPNDPISREMPTFEKVFEKKTVRDESDIYSEPIEQKERFEEWKTPESKS